MSELQKTIDLRSTGHSDEALAEVESDRGKELMAAIRQAIADMHSEETALLERRSTRAAWLEETGQAVLLASLILVIAFGALALFDARRRVVALQQSNTRLQNEAAERLAAENQVRQLQKMEAVGQLMGGIAHDFNNMLAIVIGSLELARRRLAGTEHPAVMKCIDNAAEGANRAATLTARLLAFSRQQPLEPRVIDVNKLAGGMSELLQRSIGEAIHIETVLDGGLWKVLVDPAQLESAIVNLAVNARDAMPDGGKLTIETQNAELDERYAAAHNEVAAGQYVVISVTDSGVGMSREVLERAFDPFYTTKGPGQGTGLGLSQVFGFVKQSSGHIKLYSEVGHGTTVKIYLPRHRGESPVAAEEASPSSLPKGTADTIILVVEDEAGVRKMTVDAIRELGYAAISAQTPREALQQLEIASRRCASLHGYRHARNERTRAVGHGAGPTTQSESALHDRVYAQRRRSQRRPGCRNRPDPKALHAGAIGAEAATGARKVTAAGRRRPHGGGGEGRPGVAPRSSGSADAYISMRRCMKTKNHVKAN